jgi:hypothetical protein
MLRGLRRPSRTPVAENFFVAAPRFACKAAATRPGARADSRARPASAPRRRRPSFRAFSVRRMGGLWWRPDKHADPTVKQALISFQSARRRRPSRQRFSRTKCGRRCRKIDRTAAALAAWRQLWQSLCVSFGGHGFTLAVGRKRGLNRDSEDLGQGGRPWRRSCARRGGSAHTTSRG